MSEVQDVMQVILVCGKAAYGCTRLMTHTTVSLIKTLNTIYLAKWKGKTSLGRLRQIKGDDLVFLNISSEERADLKAVERELKDHGILFARMPDLCGGDGRTQYAVAATDVPKLKPMLLDHGAGSHAMIRMGLISESDYVGTSLQKDGTSTGEMRAIIHSAKEERAGQKTIASGKDKDMKEASRDPGRILGRSDLIKLHDLTVSGRSEEYAFIDQPPILSERGLSIYVMPDGLTGVFIQDSLADKGGMRTGTLPGGHQAVVFADSYYTLVRLDTMQQRQVSGKVVMEHMKQPSLEQIREDLMKELQKMKEMKESPDIGRKSRLPVQPGPSEHKGR